MQKQAYIVNVTNSSFGEAVFHSFINVWN